MNRNKLSIIQVLIVCALAVIFSGCSSAPKFSPASISPDKGVVYIYRPHAMLGMVNNYGIFANDKHICTIGNNMYFPYVSAPGEVKFWTALDPKNAKYVKVEPGMSYYIRSSYGWGPQVFRVVRSSDAKTDNGIMKCKLLR